MANVFGRFDWRLVALLGVVVGAGAVQTLAAAGAADGDVQLLVIGTAAILMFSAVGIASYLLRGGG
ncbi:hypothetical protein NGM10_03505 [Halorussus salilacus]|uniref:hypothetical protein n=1 Tax=Halorussus salilacus TaxID=2953750 RepID=UPI0020A0A066|nr:hypothetical protein [Halorussus salilacus]USZ68808.1 hypothetical protein NGM10_03505 [Halorussus salilacus]